MDEANFQTSLERRVRFEDMERIQNINFLPLIMDTTPGDVEAPKDPGVQQTHYQSFSEQDFEGHRAHTVYVGLHLPGIKRRSHHRRHRHHHKNGIDKDPNASSIEDDDRPVTPPAQRVQFILGEDADDGTREPHPLFTEMSALVYDGSEIEWRENARWIKFEEDVEEGGNRWSKPHVATLTLHSLFELRSMLLNGTVMLDMDASSVEQISDLVIDNMVNAGSLQFECREKVKEALLRRHRHLYERRKEPSASNVSRLPIIRSLAEIGRNHSSTKRSASSPSNQGMERSHSSGSINRNLSSGSALGELNGEGTHSKGNTHFMRKIPPGAEASNILVGEVDFLEKTVSAFVRLNHPTLLGDLTEVPVPTRFLFILLGPTGGQANFHEAGRAMAALMTDEVFHEVAYKARNRSHLLAAVDEFLDAVTVLPPGEWDPSIRIEPPAAVPSQDQRKRPPEKQKDELEEEEDEQKVREEMGLARSGRFFGGLINDIKRKTPWYWSDFKDALSLQCIASWVFLYFACLSPIITFGGLLGHATGNNMAAMESLVSGFVCGMFYGFFSGQPLTILGSTGPVLVFETIMYEFCQSKEWDYMSFRFWIGMWIAAILFIFVAVDASALVCYITRFTEENFACLIAFIFIYKALENVLSFGMKYPIKPHDVALNYNCSCIPFNGSAVYENITWTSLSKEDCVLKNGTMMGDGCGAPHYVADVFLMSVVLFFGTFIMSVQLKDFKNSLFFPSKVRQVVSDFAVFIAIMSMTGMDYYFGVDTPKLQVPAEFKPTLDTRGWFIPPFNGNPVWTSLLAVFPALLGTILIFMDQQITAVIVNRKENKLKKGCGYHLDLLVLTGLIVICSVMGLPWFVAATVLSINHVNSLKVESECAAPGEKPHFLGVREQRVTHILIFLTIGLSVVLTPVLGYIPMPVLFGVFLYMGVASLKGLQFFDRLLIMLMPAKYQPDHMFLRQVPLKRVHIFTGIQLGCLVLLWLIKSFSATSILFPLMLVVMVGIRKLLDFMFTRRELKILDDIMPETIKRTEEERRQMDGEEGKADIDPSGNLQIALANGNIMKIPLASINISEEVNKTGIWKQVNEGSSAYKDEKKKKSPDKNSSKSKKRGSKKDAVTDDEKTRLSTMAEEEEEEGFTIKVGIGTSDSKV